MSPLAASALAACEVRFVVIGGCALVLHELADACADLDIVPEPQPENLARLGHALDALGAVPRMQTRRLSSGATTFDTPYGRIDVLLGCAGAEYHVLESRSETVEVLAVGVRVAAVDDVLRLRARHAAVIS